jgi:carbamoyltransferase
MKHILGISAGFHDAGATVIDTDGNILFAGHSERYSKIKNDKQFCNGLLHDLTKWKYDTVAYYEKPWKRQVRSLLSGEPFNDVWTTNGAINSHLHDFFDYDFNVASYSHHLSHAAAGFQTSPFDEAVVVIIDAIGELDTISIYEAYYDSKGMAKYRKVWGQHYPHSVGLFYSAVTDHVGLKAMDEEYITMGMSAYGTNNAFSELSSYAIESYSQLTFNHNFHIGNIDKVFAKYDNVDMAFAAQKIADKCVTSIMQLAKKLTGLNNVVFMGGVALNCVINSGLGQLFDNIWIMPNPGDAGSSLGAAALSYGKKLKWTTPFLGHEIRGDYPIEGLIGELLVNKIVGVANGRAEFGPRALGNRSLLADPRGVDIKDKVNEIKRRQKFRPFAPMILEEYAHYYFKMPKGWDTSPYMQTVAICKSPDEFPAIAHIDNTSRVQTVPNDGSGPRRLLEKWFAVTGCPMLLNTSLNIRGEPMVNDRADADRFERLYGVKVWS